MGEEAQGLGSKGTYSDCCGSILCSCPQALSPALPFCAARESDEESVCRSGFLFVLFH